MQRNPSWDGVEVGEHGAKVWGMSGVGLQGL